MLFTVTASPVSQALVWLRWRAEWKRLSNSGVEGVEPGDIRACIKYFASEGLNSAGKTLHCKWFTFTVRMTESDYFIDFMRRRKMWQWLCDKWIMNQLIALMILLRRLWWGNKAGCCWCSEFMMMILMDGCHDGSAGHLGPHHQTGHAQCVSMCSSIDKL